MEQRANQSMAETLAPEEDAVAWRSFGSVASRLVAGAEAARSQARFQPEPELAFLAWAAE